MKDVFNFIAWQWNRWSSWQRVYIISMFLIAVGCAIPGLLGALILAVGLIPLLSWMFKFLVWDSITSSYSEYKKEKNASSNTS